MYGNPVGKRLCRSPAHSAPNLTIAIADRQVNAFLERAVPSLPACAQLHGPRGMTILPFMDLLWTPWRYRYVSRADTEPRQGVPAALSAWPGDTQCVFCNLQQSAQYAVEHGMAQLEADRAANIILRAQHCFVCMNAYPYNSGHAMILPYAHTADFGALDAAVATEMMLLAQKLERALRRVYRPEGVNLGLNLGKAAGAGVAGHLHLHMLPRWTGDTNFMTVTGETRVLPENVETAGDRLRDALAQV